MPGVHAVLSASASQRWLNCPPSARLEEKLRGIFGEGGSVYAREGTKAHTIAELKLRKEIGEINEFSYNAQRASLGDIPKEMDTATDYFVDIVMSKLYAARKISPDAKLLLEQRLDYSEWVPHGFGTGDVVIISDATLEIIDFKYGKGVPVSAIDNTQARLYGLGAIHEYGVLYGFTHVRNTIIQPRLESVTEETKTREDLLAWGEEIRPTAELAWRGEGEFKTGDHCKFCAARAICSKRASEAMSLFRHGFEAPGILPDEAIPGILAVAATAESWLKDIRAYALNRAMQGVQWPGYKLVRGKRSARQWTDEEHVTEQLIRAGYDREQFIVTKMRSVAEMEEKLGRPAFTALVGQYVTQNEGALTLAPEDDKRIEYSSADAAFADLIEN